MLEHKYGFNSKEDALISFLAEKNLDFAPLFYNSSIPIKELFYFFVIAKNSLYCFNRIPSLFIELENFNIVQVENKAMEDLQRVRRAIRNESITTGVLVKTISNEKNARWEYIKAQGRGFIITNGSEKNSSSLSAVRFRKIYGGEIVKLRLTHNSIPSYENLLAQRLFKPEQYVPFYFVESDLNGIENLNLRMSNMFYAYKVTRYRMMEYYSHFIEVEFIRNCIKQLESAHKLLIHLNEDRNRNSKCFALLNELNQIDVFMMSNLKEKMGAI